MSYSTTQQAIDACGEDEILALTDFQGVGEINEQVLDRARSAVDALIDTYLARRYAVPLSAPVPDRITECALTLLRCKLYTHDLPEDVADACAAERRWLESVAAGKLDVPGLTEKTNASAGVGSAQFSGSDPVFGRDHTEDF